jgi:hypothetical protein
MLYLCTTHATCISNIATIFFWKDFVGEVLETVGKLTHVFTPQITMQSPCKFFIHKKSTLNNIHIYHLF